MFRPSLLTGLLSIEMIALNVVLPVIATTLRSLVALSGIGLFHYCLNLSCFYDTKHITVFDDTGYGSSMLKSPAVLIVIRTKSSKRRLVHRVCFGKVDFDLYNSCKYVSQNISVEGL